MVIHKDRTFNKPLQDTYNDWRNEAALSRTPVHELPQQAERYFLWQGRNPESAARRRQCSRIVFMKRLYWHPRL